VNEDDEPEAEADRIRRPIEGAANPMNDVYEGERAAPDAETQGNQQEAAGW
jgi:hypothetical protein